MGFMPFAIAFVSNVGSSTEEAWENSIQLNDQYPGAIPDYSIWLENGGSNLTSWYDTYANVQYDADLDCAYITNGGCAGFYDDDTQYDYKFPLRGSQNLAGLSTFYSNDYYGIRTTQVSDSHRAPGTNNQPYAGRSGSSVFSWYLSPIFLNEIPQGDTIDSLRYFMIDSNSFSCDDPLGYSSNITFEGEISFIYDNQELKYTNFEFEKYTKYSYAKLNIADGSFSNICSIGFIVEFDFTGFESLEIYTHTNLGDFDNTSTILTLKNFENKDSSNIDFGNTQLPFTGTGVFDFGVQHQITNPVETGFLIKTSTLFLSIITLGVALVSTPYWDPFRNFFKGAIE